MPILRGAVTFSRFHAEPLGKIPRDKADWLLRGLRMRAFEPLEERGEEERAAGFVELENHDSTEFSIGAVLHGEWLLAGYRIDQIRIPPAALKEELERWMQAYEKDKGRPPGRFERAEARLAIRLELRAQTNPRSRTLDLAWNLQNNGIQVWCVSRKLVEEIQLALEKSFDVKLVPVVPQTLADGLGIEEAALKPTPELSWPGFGKETSDGQA